MEPAKTLEQFLQRASDVLFPDETSAPAPLTVHSKASDGDTPLHVAALWGDIHAAQMLLDAGAQVDAKGDMSCTPLCFAVMSGHVNLAEILLQYGADPDAQSELGFSPRDLVARERNGEMKALFVRYS